MPHSLRVKIKGLRYKGILEDKDYKRLCHALDLEKAEQEQKTWKWIPIPYQLDYETDAECSVCHGQFIDALNYKFCPNCNAKMERSK